MTQIFLEASKSDKEAINILNGSQTSAIWDHRYELYSIDENEYQLYPELKALKSYTLEQAKERGEKIKVAIQGLYHTEEEREEVAQRVYLDFVPLHLAHWVEDPDNGFKFDEIEHKYYCSKEFGYLNKGLIQQCQNNKQFTVFDINFGKPTLGKELLAMAMNEGDYVKRQEILALAINECAKEKALGMSGAVSCYNEIYQVMKKAGHKVPFNESAKLCADFYNVAKAKSSLIRSSKVATEVFSDAEQKSLNNLGRRSVESINNRVEGQLLNLANAVNKIDNEEIIGRLNKIFADHLTSVSTKANFELRCGQKFYDLDLANAGYNDGINKIIEAVSLKYSNLKNNPDKVKEELNLISQIKSMKKITDDYAQLIDNRTVKVLSDPNNAEKSITNDGYLELNDTLKKVNENINIHGSLSKPLLNKLCALNNGEAGQLMNVFAKKGFHKPKIIGSQPFTRDLNVELSPVEKPLYLVMDLDQRMKLSYEQRSKLKVDPFHGALCVADTLENRSMFAQFIPTDDDINKMKQYFVSLQETIAKHLNDAGIKIEAKDVSIDPKQHEQGNILYKINTFDSEPVLQIFDKNTNTQNEFKLGVENHIKFENFKKEFSRAMMAHNAKEMQTRAEVSDYIADNFTNGNMLSVNDTNRDFEYFKKLGIDITDIGGFVDKTGVYSGYIFEKDPLTVETNTSVFLPMVNAGGHIINALAIADNGKQEFVKGASMKGAFSLAGKYAKDPDIYKDHKKFTELFKNAKSIIVTTDPISASAIAKYASAVPDAVVVSANTTSNLKYVAQSLAKQYPNAGIAIFGENNLREAGINGENIGVHEAEYTARVALRDLRPNAKAFMPPLTKEQYANGASTFADAEKLCPDSLQNYVIVACVETANNHTVLKNAESFEKQQISEIRKEEVKRDEERKSNFEKADFDYKKSMDQAIYGNEKKNEKIVTAKDKKRTSFKL